MTLILASQSEIRARLLEAAGVTFEIRPAHIDESPTGDAFQRAARLANAKAAHLSQRYPEAWVIGADQVGVMTGQGLELQKPQNAQEALAQLERMSGKTHVFRSVACLWHQNRALGEVHEEAMVTFLPLSQAHLSAYVKTGEWQGCCGGYRLEEQGATLVKSVKGSLDAVYGLPLQPLLDLLRKEKLIFQ